MGIGEGMNKEDIIRDCISRVGKSTPLHPESESKPFADNDSYHTMDNHFSDHNYHGSIDNSINRNPMIADNTSSGPTKRPDQTLEETLAGAPIAFDPWNGDISQSTLYTEADTVAEQENNWGIVQAIAKSPYLPNTQPEDRYWVYNNRNQIGPTISTGTAALLPEQQPDAVCGWCGSFQTSYKPSQGVVLCDICSSQYELNDFTASGWGLGECRSTDQSFNPASGLNTSQSELVNYASWPDVTTSGSYGGDIDDFSWFMAS